MKKIYLLTTEHLETYLWFRDDEDFRVAMNYIAIQAACCPEVAVLAFILMSNHVHIVLRGRYSDVLDFVNQFKHRYSIYYRHKYGVKEFLRRNGVDIKYVPYENEAVGRVIAYVQMNCVAANICAHPSMYPWGTGSTFFGHSRFSGKSLGAMSARARERILHSDCSILPMHWAINEYGYISPREYVDFRAVEGCFGSPKRMQYFLSSSSKARKRLDIAENNLPAFRDQSILSMLPDLCRSLFRKESFGTLSEVEKSELVRQIRFRFSADANQIARVCGITYSEAARLLDSA